MISGFQDLGVGVGLRPIHYPHFLNEKPNSVSWVEVISENFMDWKNRSVERPLSLLEKVRAHCPIVLHGVSLSIGSGEPLNQAYLVALKQLIQRIEPAWVSDHLCWTGIDGVHLHDLLPLPYTKEALNCVTEKLLAVQDFLGRRILIENPSTYLQFVADDMPEWEFLKLLCIKADCGILLDLNNIYVNSINHNFDPFVYLKSIPKERVCQIHLAGHSNQGTHLIDTHDAPICQEVWQLYQWAVEHFGMVSAMIERDDHIPPWDELEEEVKKLAFLRKKTNADFKRAAALFE